MNFMLLILCFVTLLLAIGNPDVYLANGLRDTKSTFIDDGVFDSYQNPTNIEEQPDVCNNYESEACAKEWLQVLDIVRKRNSNRIMNAKYQFSTDINQENENLKMKMQRQALEFTRTMGEKSHKFKWRTFKSSELRRSFKMLTSSIQSSNKTVSQMLLTISDKISNIYNHGRPCHEYCLDEGEPAIVDVFATERNYDKLTGFWLAWNNETGRRIKNLFVDRLTLENIGAKENGYSDAASFELENDFEEKYFNETVMDLYQEILPLYKQLHGYVRYCLAKFYPGKFNKTGPIPAHILGNVWAQQWNNILPILQQCRGEEFIAFNIQDNVNRKLRSMSTKAMFGIAEKFYASLGMPKMTSYFWERSTFRERSGKSMDCHASAHDFYNGVDFRIKMCAKNNINDFSTIHHEMGHIQYFMAYKELPYLFQSSANPGFHEAIGDTIALSVKTPEHLKRIGLISKIPMSEKFDIDYLLATALEKVAFLPFAITMDSYIWSVYNGSVPYNKLNKHWWDLRYRFQGLTPPVQRTEHDFDPASKYHIAIGISYIRYFASFIYQFQFYEAMCQLSGYSGPLHRCDFFQSRVAGARLLKMLKRGRSQHWKESIEILTGERDITTKPMMTFFQPLYNWLKITNEKLQIPIGW